MRRGRAMNILYHYYIFNVKKIDLTLYFHGTQVAGAEGPCKQVTSVSNGLVGDRLRRSRPGHGPDRGNAILATPLGGANDWAERSACNEHPSPALSWVSYSYLKKRRKVSTTPK